MNVGVDNLICWMVGWWQAVPWSSSASNIIRTYSKSEISKLYNLMLMWTGSHLHLMAQLTFQGHKLSWYLEKLVS